LYWLW